MIDSRTAPGQYRRRGGRARLVATACAALALATAMAQANVFVEDRREQRDASAPIFRSVGLLHLPDVGAGGTAFLVGRCLDGGPRFARSAGAGRVRTSCVPRPAPR